jgi:hypothetical protein
VAGLDHAMAAVVMAEDAEVRAAVAQESRMAAAE